MALANSSPCGLSQVNSSPRVQRSKQVHVPFVGCPSDGQVGPLKAPTGDTKIVIINEAVAKNVAYYKAEEGLGVLAPRGWHCFSTYGSNGSSLFISPEPIKSRDLFSRDWKGFPGPAIQVSVSVGDTSGRFEVAGVIARVFPAHRSFVDDVIAEKIRPATDFPSGPYPGDKLTYLSDSVVEFETPANAEGLGTQSFLKENDQPIKGIALLFGEELNLVQASTRLPKASAGLVHAIIQQLRHDAETSE